MGHKIHPTGLRLGITQEHRSRWYAPSKTYPTLLQEDDRIRKFIHKKYSAAGASVGHCSLWCSAPLCTSLCCRLSRVSAMQLET